MSQIFRIIYTIVAISFFAQTANAIETSAKQALLIDFQTGVVLFEKNANEMMVPSSMTKIMTVYMVFDLLNKKKLSLKDKFVVNKSAWQKGGSRMYLELGSSVSVDDLLRGIVVQSGNDASIAVAEGIANNEAVFAVEMTEKANSLGANNTTFKNATGWPDPQHMTTARDLAVISTSLIKQFPDFYKTYFSQKEFTYNHITQKNRNPLVHSSLAADGIKTGQTEAGGAGLVGSVVQKGRRLLLVINGCKDGKERAAESEKLFQWGFSSTMTPKLLSAGQELVKANVWLGNQSHVPLVAKENLYVTVPRADAKKIVVEVHYADPLPAPITAGQEVGKIVVTMPDKTKIEKILVAGAAVDTGGFFERIGAAFNHLIFGSSEKR